jgi:hypothetical protein
MEDTGIDSLTKKIMADSYSKLNDPAFNDIVMGKILQVEKRKMTARIAFYFFIVMITSATVIYFTLQNLNHKITGMSGNLPDIPGCLWLNTKKVIDWISGNDYFIFPLIIILVFKKIVAIIFKRRINFL